MPLFFMANVSAKYFLKIPKIMYILLLKLNNFINTVKHKLCNSFTGT